MAASIVLSIILAQAGALTAGETASPEDRAWSFLGREVPRWSAKNKCYSCHNNGDAARALYAAIRLGYSVPATATADTTRWLSDPDKWEQNGGDGKYSDKGLARIQFAAALAEATAAKQIGDRRALRRAAQLIARDQQPEGYWKTDADAGVGSPATYGSVLATVMARQILEKADADAYRQPIARANRWLRERHERSVLDAAAIVIAFADDPSDGQRRRCLELIRRGQSKDGGWGPYSNSASEPFDTAVVLLAMAAAKDSAETRALIRKGRAYLVATQKKDGSWQETTRPAGADSYAQRISTTGWATLALLATGNH